jgi:hypothetical protein
VAVVRSDHQSTSSAAPSSTRPGATGGTVSTTCPSEQLIIDDTVP